MRAFRRSKVIHTGSVAWCSRPTGHEWHRAQAIRRCEYGTYRRASAIPSNSTVVNIKGHHIAKTTIIGISIGAVTLIIILALTLLSFVRKCLRSSAKRKDNERCPPEQAFEPPPLSNIPTQEMPNNSLWNIHRELVDNGNLELQNEHINELPLSMTPIPEEALTSTSAPNSVVIQYLRIKERHTISTHPINSVTSSRCGLETAEVRMPPIRSPKIKSNYSSRSHLNKKLPPTPISIPKPAKLPSSNPRSIPTSVATARSSTSLNKKSQLGEKVPATLSLQNPSRKVCRSRRLP